MSQCNLLQPSPDIYAPPAADAAMVAQPSHQSYPQQQPLLQRKLFMQTWGCQMNVYDSDRMAELLAPLGYVLSAEVKDADLVILNTCHIREKATEKLFSELGRINLHKQARARNGSHMMIAVAGCVAQAEGDEIRRRAPYVDLVVGSQSWHHLPRMIAQASRNAKVDLQVEFEPQAKFDSIQPSVQTSPISAFLSIQEGCDKFCAFCVVPYTRGAEYSRSISGIIDEARALVDRGAREITLLGQNVNAFHGEAVDGNTWGLGRLLRALAEIPGLLRLRYTTSHPRDMDDDLIDAHRDLQQLMPFLHLPVQSGSDSVLAAMNRRHKADDYRRIIEKLRNAQPVLALSSDFIVGFPGESDADFADTLALVREIKFAQAFSFAYSRRPGTPAAASPDLIADNIKSERLHELQALLRSQQEEFNAGFKNSTVEVLIENQTRNSGVFFGRTPWMQATMVSGDSVNLAVGTIVRTHIMQAHGLGLGGHALLQN